MKSNWTPNQKPFTLPEEITLPEGVVATGIYVIHRESTEEFLEEILSQHEDEDLGCEVKWNDDPNSAIQYRSLDHALSEAHRIYSEVNSPLAVTEVHLNPNGRNEVSEKEPGRLNFVHGVGYRTLFRLKVPH
jgi:hypothetical protein